MALNGLSFSPNNYSTNPVNPNGMTSFNPNIPKYPNIAPTGMPMEGYTSGNGSYQTRPMSPMMPGTTDRGGNPYQVTNPAYVPQGMFNSNSGSSLTPTWQPTQGMTKEQWAASKPQIGNTYSQPQTLGEHGNALSGGMYYSNPMDAANMAAHTKYGYDQGFIPKDDNMFSLSNLAPLLMAAGPFASAAGMFAPAAAGAGAGAGASPLATSGPMGAAGGLGGASGTVGSATGLGGAGLGGGGAFYSGATGAGGLGGGVGVGAGTAGTLLGSGMTSGPAAAMAGGASTAGGGLSSFLDSIFGPGTGSKAGGAAGNLLGGALGQGALDLITGNSQKNAGQTAAGLADPFASQRSGYQDQLKQLMADPNSILNDPAYKFRFGQGMQALTRNDASRGYLGSGNILHDITDYAGGAASDELNKQKQFLAGLSGSQFGPGYASQAYLNGTLPGIAQTYQGIGALGTAGRTLWDNRNNLSNLFG